MKKTVNNIIRIFWLVLVICLLLVLVNQHVMNNLRNNPENKTWGNLLSRTFTRKFNVMTLTEILENKKNNVTIPPLHYTSKIIYDNIEIPEENDILIPLYNKFVYFWYTI